MSHQRERKRERERERERERINVAWLAKIETIYIQLPHYVK